MSTTVYFTDARRRAALHLLDSPFGERLAEIDNVTIEDADGALSVRYFPDLTFRLSSGEVVLMAALCSLATAALPFRLADLEQLDPVTWERVIGALFIARGRVVDEAVTA